MKLGRRLLTVLLNRVKMQPGGTTRISSHGARRVTSVHNAIVKHEIRQPKYQNTPH